MRAPIRTHLLFAIPTAVLVAGLIAIMPGIELVPALNAGVTSDTQHHDTIVDGLRMFAALPLFGGGLGVYVHNQIEQLGTFSVIHSTPVWLLAETGLIGFLAFVLPAARTLVIEWKRRDSDEPASQLIVASLIAFAITSLTHELLYQRAMWLLLGAGFAAAKTMPRCVPAVRPMAPPVTVALQR